MSDYGVRRTAPAAPGLLTMMKKEKKTINITKLCSIIYIMIICVISNLLIMTVFVEQPLASPGSTNKQARYPAKQKGNKKAWSHLRIVSIYIYLLSLNRRHCEKDHQTRLINKYIVLPGI